jgi:hypothetical protein
MARTHSAANQGKKDHTSRGTNFKFNIAKRRIRDGRSAVRRSVAGCSAAELYAIGRSLHTPNLEEDLVNAIELDPRPGYLVNDIWSVIFKQVIQSIFESKRHL